jgi:tetratricopeptide (TPR) repeat protein
VTTVVHTLWSMGALERAFDEAENETLGYMQPNILIAMGRPEDALSYLQRAETKGHHPASSPWYTSLHAALRGSFDEAADACERIVALNVPDPESLYHMVRTLAYCQRSTRAVDLFNRTVDEGYFNVPLFERDPWVDSLRGDERFIAALERARARHQHARHAFEQADRHRLFAAVTRV